MEDFLRGFSEGLRETRLSKRFIAGAVLAGASLGAAALILAQWV